MMTQSCEASQCAHRAKPRAVRAASRIGQPVHGSIGESVKGESGGCCVTLWRRAAPAGRRKKLIKKSLCSADTRPTFITFASDAERGIGALVEVTSGGACPESIRVFFSIFRIRTFFIHADARTVRVLLVCGCTQGRARSPRENNQKVRDTMSSRH